MNVFEAIELFKSEVINEILHSAASEEIQSGLIDAISEIEKTIIESCKSSSTR